jgi:hypothetical protein
LETSLAPLEINLKMDLASDKNTMIPHDPDLMTYTIEHYSPAALGNTYGWARKPLRIHGFYLAPHVMSSRSVVVSTARLGKFKKETNTAKNLLA